MTTEDVAVEVLSPVRADVFLHGEPREPWRVPLISYLDRAGIRVIGDIPGLEPDTERMRRIAGTCAGCISVGADPPPIPHLQLPHLGRQLSDQTCRSLDDFIAGLPDKPPIPAYAFMIGRLERDFAHAREAFRAAVEKEAGITCLWSGDGRHLTKSDGVRGTTNTLIQHATFVIADLSLGAENPDHENPSRAHEIGLATAFGRPLMLCSREPRRHPYFSVGDNQIFFWADEEELFEKTIAWIGAHRAEIARTVWNDRLSEWGSIDEVQIRASPFTFDLGRSYLWPDNRPYSSTELWAMSTGVGGIAVCVALAASAQKWMEPAIYFAMGFFAVSAWVAMRKRASRRVARFLPPLLVFAALALVTVALVGAH